MDKYTKFILTIIAVGVLGLNYSIFNEKIISNAYAADEKIYKVALCDVNGQCAQMVNFGGGKLLGSWSLNTDN